MENKDEKLWLIATQRAQFKGKVFTYLAVNAFLWILWWFTHGSNNIKIEIGRASCRERVSSPV